MKVELMSIEKLVPYARNPRITAHAVDKVAASIKEFGFRQPIVVDSEMVIIVGHVRYHAAQKLALKKVPVHVMEGATPEQVKAYRIADNRTGEEAEWDIAGYSKARSLRLFFTVTARLVKWVMMPTRWPKNS